MQNAADHPPIIDPRLARPAAWQVRINGRPGLIRKPEQTRHLRLLISQTRSGGENASKPKELFGF
nr:hypothetical protein [Roseomonas sp. SXEYE001]